MRVKPKKKQKTIFIFLELCHDWECAAKLSNDCPTRQVIIRSGVVLGRTGGMIKQIFVPFFMGLGGPIGSGNQYMPWIHIRDLVSLFVNALKDERYKGVYNGVAPQVSIYFQKTYFQIYKTFLFNFAIFHTSW